MAYNGIKAHKEYHGFLGDSFFSPGFRPARWRGLKSSTCDGFSWIVESAGIEFADLEVQLRNLKNVLEIQKNPAKNRVKPLFFGGSNDS